MSLSRRCFVADASASACLPLSCPNLPPHRTPLRKAPTEDTPHDSYDFWNGFFDSVNPTAITMGRSRRRAGPRISFPILAPKRSICTTGPTPRSCAMPPTSKRRSCWTTMAMWPSAYLFRNIVPEAAKPIVRASQLRVDTTQIHPYMNIIAPLAWTAIASLTPDKAGKVSLDQLGFKTIQATQGTSKILLTRGTGKLAVNVSRLPPRRVCEGAECHDAGAKIAVPLVSLAGHQRARAQRFYRGC
jgi:hypothetical protein